MGTTEQGKKAAATIKKRDPDFYKRIGAIGAKARKTHYKHFEALKKNDPEALREISTKGGRLSQRKK